ncbi:MAG: peptidase S10 [Firmicutes bacterium]|nr:peptidase S10 [Bacillota bacterium]
MLRKNLTAIIFLFLFSVLAMYPISVFASDSDTIDADKPGRIEIKLKGFSQKDLSVTHHQIKLGNEIIRFKATAGYMPVQDDKEKTIAKIFFIAYEKEDVADKSQRPVTFAFNGGPGSSSVWLHFGALGPKRAKLTDKGELPPPPYKFVDNEYTWLEFTDLVFIDPVDTGYSRAADKKDLRKFMGVREDIESVGDFIRLYITINKRWGSPKYVAGESYGAIRAAGLSAYLQNNLGMHLNGVIMISQALNYQAFCETDSNDLPYILYLPSYTTSAWYHKKLPAKYQSDLKATLKEVESWAVNQYMPALIKGSSITPQERDEMVEKLASYTGLSKEFIINSNYRVKPYRFRKELLKNDRRSLGYYDGRLLGVDQVPEDMPWPMNDPTFFLGGPFSAAVNDYIREGLNYVNDLPYNVFSENTGDWNYKSAVEAGFGFLDQSQNLANSMNRNKYLKLFVACGYYDLCTPYFSSIYSVNRLELDPSRRKNIRFGFYDGGHMFYTNINALKKFRQDIGEFYKQK